MAAVGPAFMLTTERFAPSFSGRGAFPPIFRLSCAMGAIAGAYLVWERSCCTCEDGTQRESENASEEANPVLDHLCSTTLRLDREQPRSGNGYEGDGGQSQEGRAAVRA